MKPTKKEIKAFYMGSCSDKILARLPQLQGRFENYLIWDNLNYLFLSGKMIDESVEIIVNRALKQMGN